MFQVLLENVHKSELTKGACFICCRIIHGFIQEKAMRPFVLFESDFFFSIIMSYFPFISVSRMHCIMRRQAKKRNYT